MAEKKELVTRSYTRKASEAYRNRHDILSLTLDKGEREKYREAGMDNQTIIDLLRAEYKRRTEGDGESFMPKPTNLE
jgi:hypothetical protein